MTENIDRHRRRFIGGAATAIAAARLGVGGAAAAQPGDKESSGQPVIEMETNASFGTLKQLDAGALNVGYAEAGPVDGPPVILLHGWPYDIYSYVDVAPLLSSKGYRVIVPHLRGHGTTRFLSSETPRNGQPSAVAADVIAFMDTLHIPKAVLGGFDWGGRTVDIMAALWPERCKALVSVSGYLIGSQEAATTPLPPKAELQWWYQFYFATERGRLGYEKYRRDFAKLIWQIASPKWNFTDAEFDRSSPSLDNPDHVAIVIHSYRWRLGLTEGEPKYDELEKRLAQARSLRCPRSLWKGTLTVLRTRIPVPMAKNSLANMRIGPSAVGSDTIFLKKRRKPLRKPSLTWTHIERANVRRISILAGGRSLGRRTVVITSERDIQGGYCRAKRKVRQNEVRPAPFAA
jgi:pimeloyl-ACP methyl ester carboxylesterase